MVEITHLDSVDEQDAVPLPVEPVGKDDLSFRAAGHPMQLNSALDLVADAQVELVGMRLGKGVRLPERHVPILPDVIAAVAIRQEFERPR